MKTIRAYELSTIRMVAGREKTVSRVIDNTTLKEWVGFGWIDIREATSADKKKYPKVIYEDVQRNTRRARVLAKSQAKI